MAKPPTGRILRDVRDPTYIAEQERLRKEQFIGPILPSQSERDWLEHKIWQSETPEGQVDWQETMEAIQAYNRYERHLEELKIKNRERRMLNGEPASIRPRSILSKVPDPPWERKLRP